MVMVLCNRVIEISGLWLWFLGNRVIENSGYGYGFG